LVHCEAKSGEDAIISLLVEVVPDLEYPNPFFDQVQPDVWSHDLDEPEFKFDSHIDLD